MKNQDIFRKDGATVVITGDSLAYNRYGYDKKGRHNAQDCGAGLPSWAFALRDRIYGMDPQFALGESLAADCEAVPGLDNDSPVPFTAVFGGRLKTLYPKAEASFAAPIRGSRVVLYLQRRLEGSCVFDVYVDGALAAADVDTAGDPADFAGYGLLVLPLSCEERDSHTLSFRNIRGEAPKITVAAVGSRYVNVVLTGKGGECADYFAGHFEERIGAFRPDLLLLSLGANDRGYRTVFAMQEALTVLYEKVFARVPECNVLHLLPPSSHDPEDPEADVMPYCSDQLAEVYNRSIRRLCVRFRDAGRNIEAFPIYDLFADMEVAEWRFDNIHMNPRGNRVLLEALCEKLGINLGELDG